MKWSGKSEQELRGGRITFLSVTDTHVVPMRNVQTWPKVSTRLDLLKRNRLNDLQIATRISRIPFIPLIYVAFRGRLLVFCECQWRHLIQSSSSDSGSPDERVIGRLLVFCECQWRHLVTVSGGSKRTGINNPSSTFSWGLTNSSNLVRSAGELTNSST